MSHMRIHRLANTAAALGTCFVFASTFNACASPDALAELDEFRAAALGRDAGGQDTSTGCSEERPTPDGDYFCALSASIGRTLPLYMNVNFALDGDTLTVNAQPLVREYTEESSPPDDVELMSNRREAVGDPLAEVTAAYGSDGSFEIVWNDTTVPGEANPLTFREIGGDLILTGTFITDGVAAGAMSGTVTRPTALPLAGSTFACERTDAPIEIDPVYYNGDIVTITPCAGEGSGE